MRRPDFVSGSTTLSISNETCSHRMDRHSEIRSPVSAATRIAATANGSPASRSSSAAASAASSEGASTRFRGRSRLRSIPRTGFVCCPRHSHVSQRLNSRDAKASTRLRRVGLNPFTAAST